jgi:hypothetical protein
VAPPPGESARDRVVPQQSIPVYGNHCGPGHGDPNAPAVDAVDAACKTHDACYDRRGYFDCQCDRQLIASMPSAIAQTPSGRGKAAGVGVAAYFSQAPCVCRNQVCATIPFVGRRCTTVTVPGRGGIGPC